MPQQITNKLQPILIVEDSEDDFYATTRAFSKANLLNPIKHVLSGEQALEYLKDKNNSRPALILMDLNMPGIDGRKTLKIIKNDQSLRNIPIVVLTTSDDERDIQECYGLGANTYIQKPVDFDGLIFAIKELKEYWFRLASLPGNSYAGS